MSNGLFLNMVAFYPVAELHFAQKHHLNKDSIIYKCDGSIRYCHVNPFGRKAICRYCNTRSDDIIRKLNIKSKVIPISQSVNLIGSNLIISRIENAVMSSIASLTRISDRNDLDDRWGKAYLNIFESSKLIYSFFDKEFNQGLETLLMFNGRFCWDGAARSAAIFNSKNYLVYDFKKTTSYYEFNNISLHCVNENHNRALKFYLLDPLTARKVAEEFIESKINGIPTYEKSYTELQQKNKISIKLPENKKIISVFPSSDDEYRFLSGEWGGLVVESQVREIWELVENIDNKQYHMVIRMHPNMKGLSAKVVNSYKRLGDIFDNVTVLSPEDSTSTYTLIDKSHVCVCFCSTVATEANYLRKKVVNIGGSPYCKLPVAHYTKTGKDAAKVISDNNILKLKSKRASIIWFYYLWKYSDFNPNIKSPDEQMYKRLPPFDFKIRNNYFLRLLQSPFRAEIELRKPSKKNLDYFKRFFKSAVDILYNKFSIKL